MKRVRPSVLSCQLQPPRNPRSNQHFSSLRDTRGLTASQHIPSFISSSHDTALHQDRQIRSPKRAYQRIRCTTRCISTGGATAGRGDGAILQTSSTPEISLRQSTAPRPRDAARSIARLSALHARLQLPPRFALDTLARCLIHASADPNPARNNASLAILGQDLLAYYTSEHLIVNFPRLPVPIIFAAQYAYSGSATLASIRSEWGVELAAAPGPEVNQAYLQFKRMQPGNALAPDGVTQIKSLPSNRRLRVATMGRAAYERRGMSSRIANDDEFGDLRSDSKPYPGATVSRRQGAEGGNYRQEEIANQAEETEIGEAAAVTAEVASASFVRALAGALYLHVGDAAVKKFHQDHILSRHLELHTLFNFKQPTFDLSRLCAREDFEPPIARLLSETGRMSRTPVFVVGVFSGEDKLGEGAGASLNEARIRASAAALRAWYLYSPPINRIMRPSDTEQSDGTAQVSWIPQMIDPGEIVA